MLRLWRGMIEMMEWSGCRLIQLRRMRMRGWMTSRFVHASYCADAPCERQLLLGWAGGSGRGAMMSTHTNKQTNTQGEKNKPNQTCFTMQINQNNDMG